MQPNKAKLIYEILTFYTKPSKIKDNTKFYSEESKNFSKKLEKPMSFINALAEESTCSASEIKQIFFGEINPRYIEVFDTLIVSNLAGSLIISNTELDVSKLPYQEEKIEDFVLLQFSEKRFKAMIYNLSEKKYDILQSYNASYLSKLISFNGSLLDIFFPTHHSIISKTISFSFEGKTLSKFHSEKQLNNPNKKNSEKYTIKLLERFLDNTVQLMDINYFSRSLEKNLKKHPKFKSEYKTSGLIFKSYDTCRSQLLNFGKPEVKHKRRDFVTSYEKQGVEFHRDFIIYPKNFSSINDEIKLASFDLLYMLAIRRTKLFRSDFAKSVFNIIFPAISLWDINKKENGYAIYPCLNLYKANSKGFRRTVSLTFSIIPIKRDLITNELISRKISLKESDMVKEEISSSYKNPNSKLTFEFTPNDCGYYGIYPKIAESLPFLVNYISNFIAKKISTQNVVTSRNVASLLKEMIFTAHEESSISSTVHLVSWSAEKGYSKPWEKWLAKGKDNILRESLYKTIFYNDFINPSLAYASQNALNLEKMNLGNTLGADMTGMTLFNPQDLSKTVLFHNEDNGVRNNV